MPFIGHIRYGNTLLYLKFNEFSILHVYLGDACISIMGCCIEDRQNPLHEGIS